MKDAQIITLNSDSNSSKCQITLTQQIIQFNQLLLSMNKNTGKHETSTEKWKESHNPTDVANSSDVLNLL